MAECLPEKIDKDSVCPAEANTEILDECESIWNQIEECQTKLMLRRKETLQKSNTKLPLLKMQLKSLTAECDHWHKKSPEIISTNPDVLLALGQKELQNVKDDLEMVLIAVKSKNEQLEEDLKREQQWLEEQKQLLDILDEMEDETKTKVELPQKRLNIDAFNELQNEILEVKAYKNELLIALDEFLEEHFPLPEKGASAKTLSLQNSSEEAAAELITLGEILEILIKQLLSTPHEPYVTVSDSFWPPYIELLLRCGIALRHPEDPNRMRLEAFHI